MRAFAVVALFFFSISTPVLASFSDVPESHWARPYILQLQEEGILGGNPDGTFRPERTVNRAELAKIALEIAERKNTLKFSQVQPEMALFNDVPRDAWFFDDATLMGAHQWMMGYRNASGRLTGYFGPGDTVTRAQAIKVLMDVAGEKSTTPREMPFPDVATNAWFAAPVSRAKQLGIVSGSEEGFFYGDAPLNRAALAKMVGLLMR